MAQTRVPSAKADPVTNYAHRVSKGRVVTGEYHRLSCERHLLDLERASRKKSAEFPYYFDKDHAKEIIGLFPQIFCHSKGQWGEKEWCADCRHHITDHLKGHCSHRKCDCVELETLIGQPFELAPFQQFIVGSLFGWKHKSTHQRRFHRAYISLGRKSGKSPLASAIALYLTFCDGEPGAEGFCFATTRDQAKIVWEESNRMVKASPALQEIIEVAPSTWVLHMDETNSSFRPLGRDKDSADGKNVHLGIIDELHAHGKPDLVRVVENSTSARLQPLLLFITYAGTDRTTLCWAYDVATRKILERTEFDETRFGFIARIDEDDDWRDEKCWIKANPMLGVSPKIEDLRSAASKARIMPSEENDFRRSHLNEWMEAHTRWLSMEKWDACGKKVRPPIESHAGDPCFAGFDLGETRDLTALVLIFERGGGLDVYPYFWAPDSPISKRAEYDRKTIELWIAEDQIRTTSGPVIHHETLYKQFSEILAPFDVIAFPYDKRDAKWLAQKLESDNNYPMIEYQQSLDMFTEPTKKIEELHLTGGIRHGNDPVLRWMAANAVRYSPKSDPKKCRITRGEDQSRKIDGMIALAMAIGAWLRHVAEEAKPPSIYDDPIARPHGFLRL